MTSSKMMLKVLITIWAFSLNASAFWRMVCHGRVGLARMDPLMSPGEPAQHVHAIHGSNGFNDNATYEDLMAGDCTSCAVSQDKSVYWHPALYFQDADTGEFEFVDEVGGMLAYYFLNPKDGEEDVEPFPKGFRMIAGDSLRRNYTIKNGKTGALYAVDKPDPEQSLWAELGQIGQADLAQRAVGFNCLDYGKAPEGTLMRHYLPDKEYLDANCHNGVRFELAFPSCWTGKETDSENHKDHVAYPELVLNGVCPDGFPVRLVTLFYETIWNTAAFKQRNGKFVISNGDLQGFGYHGDFMMGWEEDVLKQAVKTCKNKSGEMKDCPVFKLQDDSTSTKCTMPVPDHLKEDVEGPKLKVLPGDVKIQAGPGPAVLDPTTTGSLQPVPTMSYKPGEVATDKASVNPGQIFYASTSSSSVPLPSPENQAAAPNTPQAAAAPAPTPAPAAAEEANDNKAVSTQWLTGKGVVSEILWEEELVTVTRDVDVTSTVYVTPTQKARRARHLHRHRGRHWHSF